ncbi:MAG: hypothetical protein ACFE8U_17175 [Candidatus Hermodarchaeota archaeon]
MPDKKELILQKMEKIGAKYLLLQFTGADGHLKGVEIFCKSRSNRSRWK